MSLLDSKNAIKQDRSALIAALEQVGAKFRGNVTCCPFHDDHRPSAGIYQDANGIWRFKCQACGFGGDIFDVRAKISGTTPAQAMRETISPARSPQTNTAKPSLAFPDVASVKKYLVEKAGNIVSEHNYTDIDGDSRLIVFRCETPSEEKTYRPVRLTDRGYCLGSPPKPWPLYNLPKITKVETVVVVEGEKCCDCLTLYGISSTTSPAGAKNAKNADWTPLAGKQIILWPDNDAEGRRYMADVEGILQALQSAPRISILDPAKLDLTEKEDVVDYVKQLQTLNKTGEEISACLSEVIEQARPVSIATEVQQRIADIVAGRYACIEWPWDCLSRLSQALLPGTVTLLVGNPGASKSFMALQAFSFWNENGLRCSLYEIEEDRKFHLIRALAQKSRQSNLTDTQWVKSNAELSERITAENQGYLEGFGRVLHTSADTQLTLSQLAQWVEQQAKNGCRIIGIDPITAAERGGDAWVMDVRFLQAIKRAATDYRCSIIFVTHPVKVVSFPDLSQVAGSAAYQRFSQTILWLESHDEKESRIKTDFGTAPTPHNRTLYILKARNGRGMGLRLAYQFNSDRLMLNELGIILKEKK